MTCYPVDKISKKEPKSKGVAVQRMLVLIGAVLFLSMAVVGPAAADQYTDMWANVTSMVNGMATVMPAVSNIILAIIQPILMLIFVGFFSGLFDSLLGGITHAFKFGRT